MGDSKFELARERFKTRQQIQESRLDLRNHTIPYYDVHTFEVQHYSDITNGIIKLLKNSEYLIDEIYNRIPTAFKFYVRPQYCKLDDGTIRGLSNNWDLINTQTVPKNTPLTEIPYPVGYEGNYFSAWMSDQDCTREIDFSTAFGPVSAYAMYCIENYTVRFLDYYGNDVQLSGLTSIQKYLNVSAFSDATGISAYTGDIADAIDKVNRRLYPELTNYYLYDFDAGYPNVLSNVRNNMRFNGIYTQIAEPLYKVYNYYNSYDSLSHCISVDFQDVDDRRQYHIEYSKYEDGPFTSANISIDYTEDQLVSVFFKISAYSKALSSYKPCGGTDFGTIQIYKQHLLQENNRKYVLTDSTAAGEKLSILV